MEQGPAGGPLSKPLDQAAFSATKHLLQEQINRVSIKKLIAWWCISLLAVLVAIAASVQWLDMPIAQYFLRISAHIAAMSGPLGSSELVTADVLLMVALAMIRIVRGFMPDYSKAVFVACGASLLAFTLNDYTLKIIFGRYNPHVFFTIQPDRLFNFMHGDQTSAFPSGHMVMATAFAAIRGPAKFGGHFTSSW